MYSLLMSLCARDVISYIILNNKVDYNNSLIHIATSNFYFF